MKRIVKQNFKKEVEVAYQFTQEQYLEILKAACCVAIDTELWLRGEWEPDRASMLALQSKAEAVLEACGDYRTPDHIFNIWQEANRKGQVEDEVLIQPVLEDLANLEEGKDTEE